MKVYIETPDDNGKFRNATCWLPMYRWEVHGYTYLEMMYLRQFVMRNKELIMKFSQDGGINNADYV